MEMHDFVNDDKTAFVWAEVKKAIKNKTVDADVIDVLKKVSLDNEEEKKLKKQIKEKAASLHMKTKSTIEALSVDQINGLLYKKWIDPLIDSLSELPDSIVSGLVSKLEELSKKYSTTFSEIEEQIEGTEKELSQMMNSLTGNDFDMQGIAEFKKILGGE